MEDTHPYVSTWFKLYCTIIYVKDDWSDTMDIINAIKKRKKQYGEDVMDAIQKDLHLKVYKKSREQSLDIPLLKTSMCNMFPAFSYLCVYYGVQKRLLEFVNIKEEKQILIILCLQEKAKKFIPKPLIKKITKDATSWQK